MRPIWPGDTVFHRLVLDVEGDFCEHCGRVLHICDHRFHRFHTLQGPMELVCRLAHCSDRACPARCHTLSPAAEMSITLPRCLVGWDVFCWLGHRRFRQHWSVPQLQDELQQTYHIQLSRDTLSNYLRRYQQPAGRPPARPGANGRGLPRHQVVGADHRRATAGEGPRDALRGARDQRQADLVRRGLAFQQRRRSP